MEENKPLKDEKLISEQQEQIRAWIEELREKHGPTPEELREYVRSQVQSEEDSKEDSD